MYIKVNEDLLKLAREPTNLNYGEILLLAYIGNLSTAYMTNETIANVLGTSIRTIKRWLSHLNELSLIEIYYDYVSGKEKRIIVPKIVK